MAKIVDLQQYRLQTLERKSFGAWNRRFDQRFRISTRLADLPAQTLYKLAAPGHEGTRLFYDLIMGALDLGAAETFDRLGSRDKMQVVDIHLFLADHVRFEMMRRAGWIGSLPAGRYRLVQMITDFECVRDVCRRQPPELARDHPEYDQYRRLTPRDRDVFIRRMLPQALAMFGDRPPLG